jgi:ribosomal protein S18 acetylase RimI-like enzyme
MIPPGLEIRLADEVDATAVRELDDLAFGPGTQRAEPGELEAGVAAGDIHVLVRGDGRPIGYLHADASRTGRIYVAGVAVRPDWQGRGLGSALIDHMLALLGDERHLTPVVTVTSPSNVRMLKALLKRGFSARWFLDDHFGPGLHRFGCQLLTAAPADPTDSIWVPAARLGRVAELIQVQRYRVRSVDDGRASAAVRFELVPTRAADFLDADPPDHRVDPAEKHQATLDRVIRDNLDWSQ